MIFTNPAKNFIEIVSTIGQLQQLSTLLDPANGQGRWDALQKYLTKNPDKKKLIDTTASLPADEALTYLLDQIGIDINLLSTFDPMGQISTKAQNAITELQKLYNERKLIDKQVFDHQDGRRKDSPGKKRKKKILESKNTFDQINDLPIIEGDIFK